MPIARLKRVVRERIGARGGIAHSVGTLVGGTAFAQAVTVLALPMLTRLYTPAEFSVLAVYASMLGVLSAVACLRLEIAIPLPERDEDAVNLLALAVGIGLTLSSIVGVVVLVFGTQFAIWLRVPETAAYLWMVPLGMAVASAYAATQYWSTRKKKFRGIARTRMVQALGGVGVQTGAGAAGLGPFGLLLGHMISGGAGFVGLARDAMKNDRHLVSAVSLPAMGKMLTQYSRFPKYSSLEALTNSAGIQVPVIMIAALALGPEAGFLMLATRIMAAPMSLVGASLAQVFLAHAPDEQRAGRLEDFTVRVLGGLLRTGVGPLLFVGIVAQPLAGVIFGREWSRVGDLIAWMMPWFILQFLASPVSMVMHVTGRQARMFAVTVAGLCLRVGAIWLAYQLDRAMLSEAYALAGGIYYGICVLIFYRAAGLRINSVLATLRQGMVPILVWLSLGIAASTIVKVST